MMRLRALALALMMAACWCVVSVPPASAAGRCAAPAGNYFNGFYQNGHPEWRFTGASSYIVVRDGVNCTGSTGVGNFTNAWVMIAGSGRYEWGQVGFERTSTSSMLRWFAQFSCCGNSPETLSTRYSTFSITNQIGVRHTFRVLWDAACRCLRANIDQYTGWLSSSFDAKADWGPQPWSPQFLAETGYLQSDVPGRSTTPTQYSGLGAQRLDNGGLISMPCIMSGVNQNPTRWGRNYSSCTAFNVWTK